MPGVRPVAALLAALALAGCANGPGTQQDSSVLGMLTGGRLGGSPGQTTGSVSANALAGAAAGGAVLGGAMGAGLDERDRQRAYAAELQALEYGQVGAPVGWHGDSAGRHGTVVPGAYYEVRGTRCRDYTHTIYIDGRPQSGRASACRNPDGSWSPVG